MKYENGYSNNVLFIITISCFLNYMRSSDSHLCTPFGPLYSGITASSAYTYIRRNLRMFRVKYQIPWGKYNKAVCTCWSKYSCHGMVWVLSTIIPVISSSLETPGFSCGIIMLLTSIVPEKLHRQEYMHYDNTSIITYCDNSRQPRSKNGNFQMKSGDILLIFAQNID